MKVLVLSNGNFIQKEIKTGLDALQKEVEGYIEIPFISEKLYNKRIDMIINEEGKLIDGLNVEIAIIHNEKIVDLVFGNVVFASSDDEGNTIGLTEEQIEFIMHELNTQAIIKRGKYIDMVKVLSI